MSTCEADPITLEDAQEALVEAVTARKKILKGQAYSIDGRSLTRANLSEVQKQIDYWRGQVILLDTVGCSGPSVRRGIPHG